MKVELIHTDFDKELYNSKATHPMQSWEWGEAKKELGNTVVRFGEFQGEELQQVFQFTLHPIPRTSYKIAYLPRSVFPSKDSLEFLINYAKKNSILFVKIEPNVGKESSPIPQQSNLIRSTHPLFPAWTQILDLKPSEEELLKNLKSKTRYNIRLAEKKGVVIKEQSDEEGFKIFSKLYFETTKRQKYFGHDQHYQKTIWNHMKNGKAHILIAYYEDTPLASYELFFFNNVLYYPYGGSSEAYRNLMGANLLMWESIRLGKKLGAESYDMWGSLSPDYPETDPWAGFTRFKEGYNTQFYQFVGTYDLVANQSLYSLYGVLNKVRNFLLKLRA
ncbi:MAG: peptidoglycan bridge formation glycyltransferase FemA/FemB family protein [Patescibacteria group bacterium]